MKSLVFKTQKCRVIEVFQDHLKGRTVGTFITSCCTLLVYNLDSLWTFLTITLNNSFRNVLYLLVCFWDWRNVNLCFLLLHSDIRKAQCFDPLVQFWVLKCGHIWMLGDLPREGVRYNVSVSKIIDNVWFLMGLQSKGWEQLLYVIMNNNLNSLM